MGLQRFSRSRFVFGTDDALVAEQHRSLRQQVPTMYLALFINILFLAYIAAPARGSAAAILPIALGVAISLRMIGLFRASRRRSVPSIEEMRGSMLITLGAAFVISLTISVWTVMFGPTAVDARAYVALFTALCTICCAACLSSLPLAAYIVIVVGTLPVSLSLVIGNHLTLASMGANILLVSPLVVGMVNRQHQQLRRMVESRSEIAAEQAKVRRLAYCDSLTGLANRRAFLDALDDAAAARPGRALAIGMVDLDGFKVINDTYGHRTGDELLVETARRFEGLAIGDALIARLGGDEFAVLFRDVDRLGDAHRRMALLAGVFDRPLLVGDQPFRLRAAIGLACAVPEAGSPLSLINRADLAMYEAKRNHSAAICVYEAGMEARTRRRVKIEQALAAPAERDLIALRYQPIVDVATSRVTAFEALARWSHPTLGEVAPAEFIPIAEQAGQISELTMHLLSLALREVAAWPAKMGLSFNLSAAEVTSPSLAGRILGLVDAHGCAPGRLSIEVTETALLGDFAAARSTLSALQRGGVRVLLDDFGAGYASISYLRELRFDGVKVDGTLVVSSTESPAACDLLVGVLDLCRAIGAPVIAEMVETTAQYDLLLGLGVPRMQGNYLARPLTCAEALDVCSDPHWSPPAVVSAIPRAAKSARRYV